MGWFGAVFVCLRAGVFLLRWLTVFPGGVLIFRFGSLGGRVYAKGGLGCVRAGKTVQRIEAHKKSPPCVKGGRGGSRRGGSTWLGCESVACDRRRSECVGDGRGGAGVTDSRACRGDPACLGVAKTVLPLHRGGFFFWGEKYRAGRGWVRSARWGGIRLLLRRGLPLLG